MHKGPSIRVRLGNAFRIAAGMLADKPFRTSMTMAGIGVAFFLCAAQVGLMVGWIRTTTAIIRHAAADIWVMARQTPAFDYGTAIPHQRLYQVRNVTGVRQTEEMFMAWNIWQRPDGRRVNVELVGLGENMTGGPWRMREGSLTAIHSPETVIVDELYLEALGVQGIGDEVEMLGRRAVIGGISEGVRTFTASPFVFTSIRSAIEYDQRYRPDEITYVLARIQPGADAEVVRQAILEEVPEVDVLTSRQFARRTASYWMLETGVGITVVVTAVLGLLVAAVIISQTLYAVTQEHAGNYATLLAVGFSRRLLTAVVVLQSGVLGVVGVLGGSVLFFLAARASARTPIPLETTPLIFFLIVLLALASCLLASTLSVKTLYELDPVSVFQR